MSDAVINIRLGLYHFQLLRGWRFRISRNDHHRGLPHGFFQVYAWPKRSAA